MAYAEPPVLAVPRPAVQLVEAVGYGLEAVSLPEFLKGADRSEPTVKGHLRELVRQRLILHVGHNEYSIPSRPTFGRLLVEPHRYMRSVLLYQDILGLRREKRWAFACLPLQRVLNVDLDRAIPVLPPDDRLKHRASRPYPEALWFDFPAEAVSLLPAELEKSRAAWEPQTVKVPVLMPRLGLALLMATLDPRFVQSARRAADKLGESLGDVVRLASRLHPEKTPLRSIHPNTVVFPSWLEAFWESAQGQHARHALDGLLHHPENDEESNTRGT